MPEFSPYTIIPSLRGYKDQILEIRQQRVSVARLLRIHSLHPLQEIQRIAHMQHLLGLQIGNDNHRNELHPVIIDLPSTPSLCPTFLNKS